jgi:hypothetical protein
MSISIVANDPNYTIGGFLVDPSGNPVNIEGNDFDTGGIQLVRANPAPGRWRLLVGEGNASGNVTSLPISGTIAFNTVQVSSAGVPNSAATIITKGSTVTATIHVTNTGNTTKDFFVDPRLNAQTEYDFAGPIDLPLLSSDFTGFAVPPYSTNVLSLLGSADPARPVTLDLLYNGWGKPEYLGTSFPGIGDQESFVTSVAPEEPFGAWFLTPAFAGPFTTTPAPSPAAVEIGVVTQTLDEAVTESTGNMWQDIFFDGTNTYNPITLGPGQSGTIIVHITPNDLVGKVISGTLNVETWAGFFGGGDEYASIPYTYKIG